MENAKTLLALDEFAKTKPKEIPPELDEYLRYVAATGDPVYQWSLVKILFRHKLLNAVVEFYESSPGLNIPLSPNVELFDFETMKKGLLERYDTFTGVPFTIQRIAELLTTPKKQYTRLDKYMRALEKNIWVVSTREPICCREGTEQTLVNGQLPTPLHTNNVSPSPERLKRQPTSFDGEGDVQGPVGDQTQSAEQFGYETVVEGIAEVPPESDTVESSVDSPTVVVASEESDSKAETNDEATNGVIEEGPVLDETTPIELPTGEERPAEEAPEPELVASATSEETSEETAEEKEKTEEITVTEISNDDIVAVEEIVAPLVVEPPSESVAEVENVDEVEKLKTGSKRKIEDVEGESEDVPNKKLDTDEPVQEADAQPELEETVVESEVEETVTEIVILSDLEETVEGEMESALIEEKTEMVVEEQDLPMDVDEASVSPMVQEDVAEPMEASELPPS